MPKIVKILIGVVGVVVVAGVIAYMTMLKPASAQKVCENFFRLTLEAVKEQTGVEMSQEDLEKTGGITVSDCVSRQERWYQNSNSGMVSVARISKCQASASSLDAYEACQ